LAAVPGAGSHEILAKGTPPAVTATTSFTTT